MGSGLGEGQEGRRKDCSRKGEQLKGGSDLKEQTCSRNCQKLVAGGMEGGRDAGDEDGDLGRYGPSSVLPSCVALGELLNLSGPRRSREGK